MTGSSIKLTSLLLFIILSNIHPGSAQAAGSVAIPREFGATYQVLYNDNRLANVTVRLSHHGGISTLHGFTHDTRGLADALNAHGVQTTTGRWHEGRFIPDNYKFSFSLIGYESAWRANFDWSSGTVISTGKKWHKKMSLENDAIDPFSLSLNIRSLLTQNQEQLTINVLDEDEIDRHLYESDSNETLDTPLGCMETTRVRRVRNNTKRTSIFWYANDHDYVPVLIQHSKKSGNDFKLRIISLQIDGEPVHSINRC